jgi:hypothetical protein
LPSISSESLIGALPSSRPWMSTSRSTRSFPSRKGSVGPHARFFLL